MFARMALNLIELESKLRKERNDDATWLVYADALQQRGDPRGEAIALGEKIRAGDSGAVLAKTYAEQCRKARWPKEGPWPRMQYRARFEQLFAELRSTPTVTVKRAELEAPEPEEIEYWQKVAGASWPEGMAELYSQLSVVELDFAVEGLESVGGNINIPALANIWDYDALENELWFDFTEPESSLHRIRPIDRFVPEAYTVLYLEHANKPAQVAYHYCGEQLIPTGLDYREWLELLFRSRGAAYWIKLATGPSEGNTWVEEGIAHLAKLFPDFDPSSMSPREAFEEVPV